MDLCGDMLIDHLPSSGPLALQAARLCPPFRRLATRLPAVGRSRTAFNADRMFNRFVTFPRYARRATRNSDLFHVVDHTYAQLVTALPTQRTGVYCHDLDAFGCLIDPAAFSRPRWFRALAGRIRDGLRAAAVVFHSTAAIGAQIIAAQLVAPDRLVLAPYGTAPEFRPDPPDEPIRLPWLADIDGRPWILHVGSCIPRKRIDVLLNVVAAVRVSLPDVRLVKVGGTWSPEHWGQIARLGLVDRIVHPCDLTRAELAEVYRSASVVLVPSDSEGFGLPVIEALACGTPVVASDLPTLREAGGSGATFAPVGDIGAWADAVVRILRNPHASPTRAERLSWAAQFTWSAHAETIARTYHQILQT